MSDVREMCELNQLEAIKILKGNSMTDYSMRQEGGVVHCSVTPCLRDMSGVAGSHTVSNRTK